MQVKSRVEVFNTFDPLVQTVLQFPLDPIAQTKFWAREFKELKRMVMFKKTNVGAAIVIVTKSECVVFNTVAMLDGKPQCVCQTEQDVAKLAIFLANDDLLINYAGRILFLKFLNLFKKKL